MLPATLDNLPPAPAERSGWPWTVSSPLLPQTMPDGRPWPRISIVTPSYNQAQYLEETLRSVLLQGYPNLQYIVMDGGSSDGSADILQRYSPWLSYWQSQKDGGQSAAIASGFERSDGEILAWINSDDRYLPGALARVARFFVEHPRVVFANGDINFIDSQGQVTKRLLAIRPRWRVTATIGRHSWAQQGCFWRRSAYLKVGGMDCSLRFCMDRDLFLRLARSGPTQRIPGPPLGEFRLHEEAKTARWVDIWKSERTMLYERYGAQYGRNPLMRNLLQAVWWMELIKRGVRRRVMWIGVEL